MGSADLPEGYLEFCSLGALESLALSRMNRAAILRSQAKALLFQLVQAEAEVQIVRWILAKRRLRDLRNGGRAEIQGALRPAVAAVAPNWNVFDASAAAGDCRISSICPIRARPAVSSGCKARREIRALKSATPVRTSRGGGASLSPRARHAHTGRCRSCHPKLRRTSETLLGTAVAERLDFEPYRGQMAAGFHAPPDWQIADTTKRVRHSPERTAKQRLCPTPVTLYVEPAARKQPPGEQSSVPGPGVPRLRRAASLAWRGERARLRIWAASARSARPVRSPAECRLASAS